MVKKFFSVFMRSAWYKRLNAKVIYELLAKRVTAADWHFMNYGYKPGAGEKPLDIPDSPQLQRYPLMMYHYLATKVDIAGKRVLEVGSGRGGGARHIAGFLRPASYTGMDLAQNAVDLANRLHQLSNLQFIQGSAEDIPLPDNSVDIIINVESCHAYGSVEKFFSEAARVLRPGGYLLLVDFRDVDKMNVLREQLVSSGLKMLSQEDITDNVVNAMEAEDEAKRERIRKLIPARWQRTFSEFAGVKGSRIHMNLKNRVRLYHRFVLQADKS